MAVFDFDDRTPSSDGGTAVLVLVMFRLSLLTFGTDRIIYTIKRPRP